jgi:hypothetical protein
MELSQDQLAELEKGQPIRLTIGETPCILMREDVYQHEVDDGRWTEEEMNLLADEANDMISHGE